MIVQISGTFWDREKIPEKIADFFKENGKWKDKNRINELEEAQHNLFAEQQKVNPWPRCKKCEKEKLKRETK